MRTVYLAIVICALFFLGEGFCESVTLKSGKKIEGKILERTDRYIKIDFKGEPVFYELKYIVGIEEDKTEAPSSNEESAPQDINLYFKEGIKYGAEEKFEEAGNEFSKGIEIDASDHNLQEAKGIIDDLKSGILKKDYALHLFKGINYIMSEQYEQAIKEFKETLMLNPDEASIYYYLGVCFHSLKDYAQAATYLEKSQALDPRNGSLYYALAASYVSESKFNEAIATFNKLLEIRPNDAGAYSLIGICNYHLGQSAQAKENLSKAKELFKNQKNYARVKEIEGILGKIN